MADEATATVTQADAEATAQAATTPETPTAAATADGEAISLEKAKELRKEAAALRQRAKTAEDKLTELERANLTELEQLKLRATEAEAARDSLSARVRDFAVRQAITEAARDPQLNARRPEALARLVDSARLEFDEEGNPDPKSVNRELLRVKQDFPELFFSPNGTADGGAGNGQSAADGFDMNAQLRRMVGRV